MKLTSAFKLSALVAALSVSGVATAVTVNDNTHVQPGWTGAVDPAEYQYADFGSITQDAPAGANSVERPVYVAEHKVGDKFYYLVDGKQILEDNGNGELVAAKGVTASQLTTQNFERGGTSNDYKDGDKAETSFIKRVDSNFVQYGEQTTVTQGAASGKVAVTNSTATNVTPFDINVAGGAPQAQERDDVKLGIIGTTKVEGKDKNTYGVVAEKTDGTGKVVASTTLTAEGIKTTGTVDAAGFSINGKSITAAVDDAVAGATQEIETKMAQFNTVASGLNKRLDDVEKTAYRGTAIALAAAQQVPNIKPGQFALFGGVGHYESESAIAFGGVAALADGRTSISAALGAAGSEVGGRVGVAYVFGGN